ncbi:DNA processing protein [Filimonas lacunae]|uniref:DNA processing protein n=1 Tax=Filimonas lacunae TaxID=477680 RepID=A0A173MMS1_9BACT|nr:DNA-processing protein DprA [Filimonas lacunae]BAV08750.1 rossmann fold nucleotide-binding protein Smf possibly [Filimonas lacunae]SIS61101.1 DNA processing protein [Filimonas lacunae]
MLANKQDDLLYQIALTMVPHIGAVQAKILIDHFGDASSVFKANSKQLSGIENIGTVRAGSITNFSGFQAAEEQIRFIEKYRIQPLFITDAHYPQRLLHCNDAPTILYYKGNAHLNATKVISVIGTRGCTHYGRQVTEKLIADLAGLDVLVVSGLALGVDAIAHKAALTHGLETVGVLAHGLDTLYPYQHKALAKEMVEHGGLLTEFCQGTAPDKHNFPKRNRIVAGMADATILIETAIKGGSIITAELAYSYNRELFAIPGKITDAKSAGCNQLIQNNKAILLTDTSQLLETMGWAKPAPAPDTPLPVETTDLSKEEQIIVAICREKELTHIDDLQSRSGLHSSAVATAVLQLELQGLLISLAGKMYQLTI